MFQFNYFEPALHMKSLQEGTADLVKKTEDEVLLSWGEHCIECAAPDCYTSCDLYRPTETGKCRRIEGGIRRAYTAGRSTPSAVVRFRRWGKIEAQGNVCLLPPAKAELLQKGLMWFSRFAAPVGNWIGQVGGGYRWRNICDAMFKRVNARLFEAGRRESRLPAKLIVEVEQQTANPVPLILTVAIDKTRLGKAVSQGSLPPPFQARIEGHCGRHRNELGLEQAMPIFSSGLPFNLSISLLDADEAEVIFHDLSFTAATENQESRGHAPSVLTPAKAAKLVVFDLDNTLWEGVLLEGKVALRPDLPALFKLLDERGILLSIASKNAYADAISQLKAFGLDQYFLHPQIGWQQKSHSIKAIVEAIDIGMDSVIFIDDNPYERAEVANVCTGVEVFDETILDTLAQHPRLQGAVTAESRNRRQMYMKSIERKQAAAGFDGDYFAFLRSCELTVTIRRPTPLDENRIIELVQRTNQLNFSGRKYDRDAILAILADGRGKRVIDCHDRFGNYGTVGFCIFDSEMTEPNQTTLRIDDFMLSCRVQGKQIERALIQQLVKDSSMAPRSVTVAFTPTDRNQPAQLVLEDIGFTRGPDAGYILQCAGANLQTDYLIVKTG